MRKSSCQLVHSLSGSSMKALQSLCQTSAQTLQLPPHLKCWTKDQRHFETAHKAGLLEGIAAHDSNTLSMSCSVAWSVLDEHALPKGACGRAQDAAGQKVQQLLLVAQPNRSGLFCIWLAAANHIQDPAGNSGPVPHSLWPRGVVVCRRLEAEALYKGVMASRSAGSVMCVGKVNKVPHTLCTP